MRLYDFLDYQACERAEAEFAIQGNQRLTYGEALAETNWLANAFVRAGLQIGDRIAILSKNSIKFILLYLAAARTALVSVPLNYRLAPAEWRYILNDAGAKFLLAAGEYPQAIDLIRTELKTVEREQRIGIAILVPVMIQACLTTVPDIARHRYVNLRLIHYGAPPLQDKVLFGSDYPALQPDRWLRDFEALEIKEEVRQKILIENARKLFKLW